MVDEEKPKHVKFQSQSYKKKPEAFNITDLIYDDKITNEDRLKSSDSTENYSGFYNNHLQEQIYRNEIKLDKNINYNN